MEFVLEKRKKTKRLRKDTTYRQRNGNKERQ